MVVTAPNTPTEVEEVGETTEVATVLGRHPGGSEYYPLAA